MKTYNQIKQELYAIFKKEFKKQAGLPDTANIKFEEGDIIKVLLDFLGYTVFKNQLVALSSLNRWNLETLTGKDLDDIASIYDLDRLQPTKAVARVKLIFNSPLTQSATLSNLVCSTNDGKTFSLVNEVTISSGTSTYYVDLESDIEGKDYNVPAGSIVNIDNYTIQPSGITFTILQETNAKGGSDEEDDNALRRRIKDTITGLTKGTIAYYSKYLNYTDGIDIVRSLNIFDDFVNYNAVMYIDLGKDDYSGYKISGTEQHYISDNAQYSIQLDHFPITEDNVTVVWKDDYYNPTNTVTLQPYNNDPTQLWDYAVLRGQGKIVFNFDSGTQYNSGVLPLVNGQGIDVTYTYYSNIFEKIQGEINNERIVGANITVYPCTIRTVDIEVNVLGQEGVNIANFEDNIKQAINTYISSLSVGDDLILSRLVAYIIDNITQVRDVEIVMPSANVSVYPYEKLYAGTIVVSY